MTPPPVDRQVDELETVPAAAAVVFGDALPTAERYARLLSGIGVEMGVIGPRESARIWTRHLLNCAAVAEVVPDGARVVDVGSGAGLPGLALAIARPDLRVDLVEPLLRRTRFLEATVDALSLSERVRVVRGRAEDAAIRTEIQDAPIVTARAVAPLDRLVRWCIPLVAPGGVLLALKGSTAAAELAEHRGSLQRLGARDADVVECGAEYLSEPTTVVRMHRRAVLSEPRKGR